MSLPRRTLVASALALVAGLAVGVGLVAARGRGLRSGGYYAAVRRREVNAGVCAPVRSGTTTISVR